MRRERREEGEAAVSRIQMEGEDGWNKFLDADGGAIVVCGVCC